MKRPNILLFFTDQQRFDTIGALGHPVIRTPSLDRLAAGGVAFTSAYTASPVCVAARCALHYGQYAWTTRCVDNGFPMPEDGRPSLMDRLTGAGYRTHGIGKCHFTPDLYARRGFQTREHQEELVSDPARDDYLVWLREQGGGHITDPHGVRGEMYYVPQPAQMPARLHPTQWVGDRAGAFVADQAGRADPWFLFASFIHPHPPFCPPAPWHKLYRAPLMPLPRLPPDHEALWTHINRQQNRYKYRDQGLDLNLLRCQRAYYFACLSFIDFQVGRVLDALERTGQLDDTLILFTADHGEHLGDYGCFGKRSMHDTAARVPMLARWPGRFEGGRRCDEVVSLVDVMPTALAAAGLDAGGAALDGVDLARVAGGDAGRDTVYAQYGEHGWGQYMAVTRRWKYFYSVPDNREFLFDRREDPEETRNRAGVRFCDGALAAMRANLVGAMQAAGETRMLDGDRWKPAPALRVPDNPDALLGHQDHAWADQTVPGYSAPPDGCAFD